MDFSNSTSKDESSLFALSSLIFKTSAQVSESFKPDLEQIFGNNSEEYTKKFYLILLEFIYFHLHLVNVITFSQLGKEKMGKLQDKLTPLVAGSTIRTIFQNFSQEEKNEAETQFYKDCSRATLDYGKCKKILLTSESKSRPFNENSLSFKK